MSHGLLHQKVAERCLHCDLHVTGELAGTHIRACLHLRGRCDIVSLDDLHKLHLELKLDITELVAGMGNKGGRGPVR